MQEIERVAFKYVSFNVTDTKVKTTVIMRG